MPTISPVIPSAHGAFFSPNTLSSVSAMTSTPPDTCKMAPNIEPRPISIAIVCRVVPTPSAKVSVIMLNGIPATRPMISADNIIAINGWILTLIIKNNNTAKPSAAPIISLSGEAVKTSISYPPKSRCKADIRNPLSLLANERSRFANPHRLVLYTLEAGDCLFCVQISACKYN